MRRTAYLVAVARRGLTPYAFLLPSILVLASVILYPIYFTIRLSLTDTKLLTGDQLGNYIGLDNYVRIAQLSDFWQALRVSGIFTLSTVAGSFVIGFAIALLLNEIGRSRRWLMTLLLTPWVISPVIAANIWRFLFNDQFGLVNKFLTDLGIIHENVPWLAQAETTVPVIIIASIWRLVPYMVIMLLAGLQSIPRELYEAAEVDGAGPTTRFLHVTVSELRYIIGVILMFALIWSFNDFTMPFVMTVGGGTTATRTLPILVYHTAFDSLRLGRSSAMATVVLLILLALSITYVRILLRGNRREATR